MEPAAVSLSLRGWSVISLRPAAQQAAACAAIEARGAHALAVPALQLEALRVDGAALAACYARDAVIFTSPAAVEHAHAALALPRAMRAIAVGGGTARALAARGIEALQPPAAEMRSEGVLALPGLQHPVAAAWHAVGIVTAPGGRGLIEPALRARGFAVDVVAVYRRTAPTFTPAQVSALAACRAPRAVLLTSAEALAHAVAGLPAAACRVLLDSVAVASSARLAQAAREAGFVDVLVAASPRVEALLDALGAHAKAAAIR